MKKLALFCSSGLLFLLCCSAQNDEVSEPKSTNKTVNTNTGNASVTQVTVNGDQNNYTFNVTISSADLGCEQYADWWEVIDLQGNLVFRRILAHSHVNEQPFSRSGGSIAITENTQVYVRVHMNNSSYSTKAMIGSVANGFTTIDLEEDFAKAVEDLAPQPNGCAF